MAREAKPFPVLVRIYSASLTCLFQVQSPISAHRSNKALYVFLH
jgi:hypothetical protein